MVSLFPSCAGLFGAAGVGVSAAAAHLAGGGTAAIAGTFLILHAAALLGLSGLGAGAAPRGAAVAGTILIVGTVLFCGDLALAGLFDLRPVPQAAPLGGLLLIAGWLALPAAAVAGLRRGDPAP